LLIESAMAPSAARNLVDQGLDLAGRPLIAKEAENDADGLFSHSSINAGLGGQPSNQFVHNLPRPQPVLAGPLLEGLILSVCDLKYKR
jgi:hypothetical protein